jgi:SAM-dependent methyltransferase
VQFYDTMARFYDAENADMVVDLALYGELAHECGDPVLDMGCGTGRVMLFLAQHGHRVVGVDPSAAMLARGRAKLDRLPALKPRVTMLAGDALHTPLAERFALIIVPYNTFMHFPDLATQLAVLAHLGALLTDDGQLVIDIPSAGEAYATQDNSGLVLERMFTEPESGHLVMQHSVSTIDRAEQLLHVTWIYDEIRGDGAVHRTLAPLVLRYVFPGEMQLMLRAAGLELLAFYGDYDRQPLVDGSPRMLTLARRAGEPDATC